MGGLWFLITILFYFAHKMGIGVVCCRKKVYICENINILTANYYEIQNSDYCSDAIMCGC